MMTGYTWTQGEFTRVPRWHLFRGITSLCGSWVIDDLTQGELEPEVRNLPGRQYCKTCQKILAMEQRKGLPPEPALSEADEAFVRQHWPTHTATEIAHLLGRTNADRVK